MIFRAEYLDFLRLLNQFDVEYLIVGGFAVNFHGYSRSTFDLDVWVNDTEENKKKLIVAIDLYGFETLKLKDLDFKETIVFHFGNEPYIIEILSQITGVTFREAYASRELFEVENLRVPFIDLNNLLRNKLLSSRHKDWDDYEKLSRK